MINSRRKGAVGERQWRDELKGAGFEARRGQQFSGSKDSPDVICPGLPSIHFEVKYTEKLSIYDAIDQAKRDAGDYKLPVVAHRKNNHEWLVIMPAQDWLSLIKETDRVINKFCQACKGSHLRKTGFGVKGRQRYKCVDCGKSVMDSIKFA